MALNWRYKERNDGEIADLKCGLYYVRVQDCDGDFSTWSVRLMGATLASGEESGFDPYHFDKCKEAAESYIRSTVKAMDEALYPPIEA